MVLEFPLFCRVYVRDNGRRGVHNQEVMDDAEA